jgi:hypothetical protein
MKHKSYRTIRKCFGVDEMLPRQVATYRLCRMMMMTIAGVGNDEVSVLVNGYDVGRA